MKRNEKEQAFLTDAKRLILMKINDKCANVRIDLLMFILQLFVLVDFAVFMLKWFQHINISIHC